MFPVSDGELPGSHPCAWNSIFGFRVYARNFQGLKGLLGKGELMNFIKPESLNLKL